MTFTPTAEQSAILDAGTSTSDNLLISALAGAAKTSTLVLLAQAMPAQSTLCLAFNKKIAEEMATRMPGHVTCSTLSSLGYSAWRSFLSRKLIVKDGKTYFAIKAWLEEAFSGAELEDAWNSYDDLKQAISVAKSIGYVPAAAERPSLRTLVSEEDFLASLAFEPSDWEFECITSILTSSIAAGFSGVIDFDDMLYLPTLCTSATFNRAAVVMIDEAQDLSPLNHAMLAKLLGTRSRLIAVGDPNQSIYAFRGADTSSMPKLEARFNMVSLSLTTSFRCATSIVKEAQWRAPAMRAAENAPAGQVTYLTTWTPSDLSSPAVVICRNNAPLFSLAIKFLAAGYHPTIAGKDIAAGLRKTLSKLGSPSMTIDEARVALELWREEQLAKKRNSSKVADMFECLSVFLAPPAKTLEHALLKLEQVFNTTGPINLMTIHKSKGLEFPVVHILDSALIKVIDSNTGKQNVQEANLLYVAQTRAKTRLTYITSDGFRQ
jgi:superfamily I DNA/RNA helicase